MGNVALVFRASREAGRHAPTTWRHEPLKEVQDKEIRRSDELP